MSCWLLTLQKMKSVVRHGGQMQDQRCITQKPISDTHEMYHDHVESSSPNVCAGGPGGPVIIYFSCVFSVSVIYFSGQCVVVRTSELKPSDKQSPFIGRTNEVRFFFFIFHFSPQQKLQTTSECCLFCQCSLILNFHFSVPMTYSNY